MIRQAVILAGGRGTRLSEETTLRPKPLVEIGGAPILWHIMKIFYAQGVTDFIICLGYKGYLIKEFFANYSLHRSDVTFDFATHAIHYHRNRAERWRVTLVDTGEETMTGGRLKRIKPHLTANPFLMTYGDGVADIHLEKLIDSHNRSGCRATVTAVTPPGRFGALTLDHNGRVANFQEKPQGDRSIINGGFFVLDPSTLDLIKDDQTIWEREPLETLAHTKDLNAYRHQGFWHPMDTMRDRLYLDDLWQKNKAPWKLWNEGEA